MQCPSMVREPGERGEAEQRRPKDRREYMPTASARSGMRSNEKNRGIFPS